MWPGERVLHPALASLLSAVRVGGELWTASGPTERAFALLEDGVVAWPGGEPVRARAIVSAGQLVLVLAAFALWNRQGGISLPQLVDKLDKENLRAVTTLILACLAGDQAVEAWTADRTAPAEDEMRDRTRAAIVALRALGDGWLLYATALVEAPAADRPTWARSALNDLQTTFEDLDGEAREAERRRRRPARDALALLLVAMESGAIVPRMGDA